MEFHFFVLAAEGKGLSGGDRIWIELARRWHKEIPITVHTWEGGLQMAERQKLEERDTLKFQISKIEHLCNWGYFFCYVWRIIKGIWLGLTLKLPNSKNTYIYNASEFWMDSLPCVVLKIRYSKINWIASWYQTAPNPLKGFSLTNREKRYRINAFYYWFMQLPVKPLISRYASKVIVNNDEEKKQFPQHTKVGRTIVLIGAVSLTDIREYTSNHLSLVKRYHAVFQGRFHAQKGVIELIDIWKKVVEKIPYANLVMIGDGPLMDDVKQKIQSEKLKNNIELEGYVFDGTKKYKIFSESKLVVHPAFFDSGGMAAAEAMAFGIPCVAFDLPSYRSYYPKGMVKVPQNNLDAFANAILDLLSNGSKLDRIGAEAYSMIQKHYSWDIRAKEILKSICN